MSAEEKRGEGMRTGREPAQESVRRPGRRACYAAAVAVFFLAAAASVYVHLVPVPFGRGAGCLMQETLGLYCPGCGGTRAVLALLLLRPLLSLYFHPVVGYAAALFLLYLLSNTAEYLSRGRWKIGLHYHNWFAYAGFAIVLANWLVRNALLVFWGVRLG